MSRLALLVSLMAATAAAQAEYASHGFKYIGCVEAEPPVFSYNVDLPAPFSAQQCQEACHAKGKYAAIDGSCHCEDPASKGEPQYNKLEDSVCVQPCIGGNTTAGWCGGPQCPVTGKKRYSLYKMDEDHCEDDKDKDIGNGFHTKSIPVRTSTTIKTITSCPPKSPTVRSPARLEAAMLILRLPSRHGSITLPRHPSPNPLSPTRVRW